VQILLGNDGNFNGEVILGSKTFKATLGSGAGVIVKDLKREGFGRSSEALNKRKETKQRMTEKKGA